MPDDENGKSTEVEPEIPASVVAEVLEGDDERELSDILEDEGNDEDDEPTDEDSVESSEDDDDEGDEDDVSLSPKARRALLEDLELRQENRTLKARVERLEGKKSKAEPQIRFNVGTLDEAYEPLRPTLERLGAYHAKEQREMESRLIERFDAFESNMARLRDEIIAERIKSDLKVTDREERLASAWLSEYGFQYKNGKQLAKGIELYRKHARNEARKKAEKSKENGKALQTLDSPNGVTRASDGVKKPKSYEQDFNDGYDKALKKTFAQLRGRSRLTA